MSDFEIQGLEEFREKLKLIERRAPDRILDKLDDEGKKLRKEVKNNTPKGLDKKIKGKVMKGGKLRKSYKLAPVEKIKGGYQKGLYSKSPIFHLIERGHMQMSQSGQELGWKEGVFMMEKTVSEQEEPIMNRLKSWLNELFEELK